MRAIDRDLIRGGHYGQRSCVPRKQAEHMAAPTNAAKCTRGSIFPGCRLSARLGADVLHAGYAPAVTVPSMRLNKHRHRRNTSDRIYQPDSQDGRKRAKGDDSNFEMKILIQATCLHSRSGVSPWPLANRKNPAALGGDRRADPPITPLQWLTG
jgi:hypothetical protein